MFAGHFLCTRHEGKYFTWVNYLALSSLPFRRDTMGLPEEEPFQSWRSMALGGRQTWGCIADLSLPAEGPTFRH